METPPENVGMLFGSSPLCLPNDFPFLWLTLHTSQFNSDVSLLELNLWASGPWACVRAALCGHHSSGRGLDFAAPPLWCGRALSGCLPATSHCSLHSHQLIYWKLVLGKRATWYSWVYPITCSSGQKKWDRKQNLCVRMLLHFAKMKTLYRFLSVGTFFRVCREFLSICWNLPPEI